MGGHVGSHADITISGKLGREIEGVLHQSIPLMAKDDASKWRLALLRRRQEGSRAFTDVHPRRIRADIFPLLRHCRACESDRTYRSASKPNQKAPSGKAFFFCLFLHVFLPLLGVAFYP